MRTPYVGDGYFQDEMGELYEFTVAIGDVVAVDQTARAGALSRESAGWKRGSIEPPRKGASE